MSASFRACGLVWIHHVISFIWYIYIYIQWYIYIYIQWYIYIYIYVHLWICNFHQRLEIPRAFGRCFPIGKFHHFELDKWTLGQALRAERPKVGAVQWSKFMGVLVGSYRHGGLPFCVSWYSAFLSQTLIDLERLFVLRISMIYPRQVKPRREPRAPQPWLPSWRSWKKNILSWRQKPNFSVTSIGDSNCCWLETTKSWCKNSAIRKWFGPNIAYFLVAQTWSFLGVGLDPQSGISETNIVRVLKVWIRNYRKLKC